MTKHIPNQPVIGATTSPNDRGRGSLTPQPLPAAEIESLLRMAQRGVDPTRPGSQHEEIGPGDVQYLRGHSFTDSDHSIADTIVTAWPATPKGPDSTLRQAEQLLVDAILNRGHDAHPAELSDIGPNAKWNDVSRDHTERPGLTLDDLGELDLDISIELGRTEILIEDILKLREGSVVSLDKLAGDPVDIIANGRLVARGELLVIDGKFGVRLSEVL